MRMGLVATLPFMENCHFVYLKTVGIASHGICGGVKAREGLIAMLSLTLGNLYICGDSVYLGVNWT